MVPCRFCAEEIQNEALVCRYCGHAQPKSALTRIGLAVLQGRPAAGVTFVFLALGVSGLLMGASQRGLEELALIAIAAAGFSGSALFLTRIFGGIGRLLGKLGGLWSAEDARTAWVHVSTVLVAVIALVVASASYIALVFRDAVTVDVVRDVALEVALDVARDMAVTSLESFPVPATTPVGGSRQPPNDGVYTRRDLWRAREAMPEVVVGDVNEIAPGGRERVVVQGGGVGSLLLNVPRPGGSYRITVERVGEFDPVLFVFEVGTDEELELVAEDDDGGVGVNALIAGELAAGRYVLIVEDFGGRNGECWVEIERV